MQLKLYGVQYVEWDVARLSVVVVPWSVVQCVWYLIEAVCLCDDLCIVVVD